MKVYTKVVLQLTSDGFHPVEEHSYEYSGPVILAKGGGGDTQVVQKNDPPQYIQDAQQDLLKKAQGQVADGGPIVAPVNADQNKAMDMTRNLVTNYGDTFNNSSFGQGKSTLGFLMDPSRLDVNSNPYFGNAVNAATRPVTENYQNVVSPQINNQAVADGGVGGSRQGVAQGVAAGKYMQTIGDISSGMANQQYNTNLGSLISATGMAPQFTNLEMNNALMPEQIQTGLGDYARSLDQSTLTEPWQRLEWLRGFVPQMTGSTVSGPAPYSNPLLGALGGGTAGYGLGSAVGNQLGSNYGGPIGAGLGALLGYYGSR